MTRFAAVLAVFISANSTVFADEVEFHKSQLVDAKERGVHADLIFSSSARAMSVRVADRVVADVPYDCINKISYEFSKHHRVKAGAIVMVASLGAGAIVMLTKSKSHWLYVDYTDSKENNASRSLVLRMDKKEYKNILRTAQAQTGKEVMNAGDAKLKH